MSAGKGLRSMMMKHNADNRKGSLTMRSSKKSIARILTLASILALVSFVLPINNSVSLAAVGGGTYSGPSSGTEGTTFTGGLGTFTDVACDPISNYVAKIDWGDGHIDTGAVSGACTYTVT